MADIPLLSNALRLFIIFLSKLKYVDVWGVDAAAKIYPFPVRQVEKASPTETGFPNFYNSSISHVIYRQGKICFWEYYSNS